MFSRSFAKLVMVVAAFASTTPAFAALDAYIQVKGEKQGTFAGASRDPHRASQSWSDAATVSSIDANSGAYTGRRAHEPLVIMKESDRTSALYATALRTKEYLTTVEIEIVKPAVGRQPEKVVTRLNLENAQVAAISNVREGTKTLERIAFSFQKITITDVVGNKSSTDDWEQ